MHKAKSNNKYVAIIIITPTYMIVSAFVYTRHPSNSNTPEVYNPCISYVEVMELMYGWMSLSINTG